MEQATIYYMVHSVDERMTKIDHGYLGNGHLKCIVFIRRPLHRWEFLKGNPPHWRNWSWKKYAWLDLLDDLHTVSIFTVHIVTCHSVSNDTNVVTSLVMCSESCACLRVTLCRVVTWNASSGALDVPIVGHIIYSPSAASGWWNS